VPRATGTTNDHLDLRETGVFITDLCLVADAEGIPKTLPLRNSAPSTAEIFSRNAGVWYVKIGVGQGLTKVRRMAFRV
jgi:hypothetical protein